MSDVTKLKLAGQVVGEVGTLVAGVIANGTNYLADLVYIPQLVRVGEDVAAAIGSAKDDLAEVQSLDEAGRSDLAASWQAALPQLASMSVDDALKEGVVVVSYGLEALGFFLKSRAVVIAPAPAA